MMSITQSKFTYYTHIFTPDQELRHILKPLTNPKLSHILFFFKKYPNLFIFIGDAFAVFFMI